MNIFEFVH